MEPLSQTVVDEDEIDTSFAARWSINPESKVPLMIWSAVAAFWLLDFAGHSLVTFPGAFGTFIERWASDVIFISVGLIVALRALRPSPERAAWSFFAVGMLLYGIGTAYFIDLQFSGNPIPIPSLADALWLSAYPMWYAGLLLLFRVRFPHVNRRLWADGLIGALSITSICAALLFGQVLENLGGSTAIVATGLAYPLADLVLIALIVGVAVVSGGRVGSFGWIASAFAIFAIADSTYLYLTSTGQYFPATVHDTTYPLAAIVLALAACLPSGEAAPERRQTNFTIVVPIVLAICCLGILLYDHFERTNLLALGLATLAIAAVFWRLASTFAENQTMLRHSRTDAATDVLTGLSNRRKLMDDLERMMPKAVEGESFVVAMFDLDGFKKYNDTFGHPAGDRLLRRLGRRFAECVVVEGSAYRVGGDEFCIVYPELVADSEALVSTAAEALSDRGGAFTVTCSYGMVAVPREATTVAAALSISDQRLYMHKNRNMPATSLRSADMLRHLLLDEGGEAERAEQDPVAELAVSVALEIGADEGKELQVRLAAELRDIGMVAVPAQVASSQGALSEADRKFFEQHPLIGERMVAGAPALGDIAPLVRSTHECFDGSGFPDGLVGEQIPLASRIVAACDSFQSMVEPTDSDAEDARVGGPVMSAKQALEALRAEVGTRFDPAVVDALGAVIADPDRARARARSRDAIGVEIA